MRQMKKISDQQLAEELEKIAKSKPKKPSQELIDRLLGEEVNNTNKGEIKMEKTNKKLNIETIKTVVIAVFITAIIAFILGINYQKTKQAEIDNKVQEAVTALKVQK